MHVGEITFGHVRHPRDRLRVGQRVRVRVIEVERDRGRVSLSLRDPTRDPWLALPARHPPGTWVEARVQHITHYGAFVEVEEGVEGLVHLSESGAGAAAPQPRWGASVRCFGAWCSSTSRAPAAAPAPRPGSRSVAALRAAAPSGQHRAGAGGGAGSGGARGWSSMARWWAGCRARR
ncbi:MAG: S1 RNA-binding domain-containing protein [Myxococcales bacterium]|nr:S1 RNA-binding domain-containing protein [Myxococcales bacterium]